MLRYASVQEIMHVFILEYPKGSTDFKIQDGILATFWNILFLISEPLTDIFILGEKMWTLIILRTSATKSAVLPGPGLDTQTLTVDILLLMQTYVHYS